MSGQGSISIMKKEFGQRSPDITQKRTDRRKTYSHFLRHTRTASREYKKTKLTTHSTSSSLFNIPWSSLGENAHGLEFLKKTSKGFFMDTLSETFFGQSAKHYTPKSCSKWEAVLRKRNRLVLKE